MAAGIYRAANVPGEGWPLSAIAERMLFLKQAWQQGIDLRRSSTAREPR